MADQADVRSIDAVLEWHAALTNYGHTLAEAMSGVEVEIHRANEWLHEQLVRWQRAIRDCEDEVVQAKAELAARRFPGFDGRMPDTSTQEKNLRKAKARLEHAEEKVLVIRSWIGKLPKAIDEVYRGPAHRLVNFLEAELPRGLALLDRRIAGLESYAGLRADYAPGPSMSSVTAAPTPREPEKPASETPTGENK